MGDRDTERLIDAWLDGELPADEAAKLETGLRCDPALRAPSATIRTCSRSGSDGRRPATFLR